MMSMCINHRSHLTAVTRHTVLHQQSYLRDQQMYYLTIPPDICLITGVSLYSRLLLPTRSWWRGTLVKIEIFSLPLVV